MFTGVYRCAQVRSGVQVSAGVYRDLQECKEVYWCVQVCTGIYRYVQVCTGIYRHVQVCIGVVQVRTGVQVFTGTFAELSEDEELGLARVRLFLPDGGGGAELHHVGMTRQLFLNDRRQGQT